MSNRKPSSTSKTVATAPSANCCCPPVLRREERVVLGGVPLEVVVDAGHERLGVACHECLQHHPHNGRDVRRCRRHVPSQVPGACWRTIAPIVSSGEVVVNLATAPCAYGGADARTVTNGTDSRPSAFPAGHMPSWRGSCKRYALSPVAAGSGWPLLLLLSSALPVRAGSTPAGRPGRGQRARPAGPEPPDTAQHRRRFRSAWLDIRCAVREGYRIVLTDTRCSRSPGGGRNYPPGGELREQSPDDP